MCDSDQEKRYLMDCTKSAWVEMTLCHVLFWTITDQIRAFTKHEDSTDFHVPH